MNGILGIGASIAGMAMKILSKGQASAAQATTGDMFLLRINNSKSDCNGKNRKG